MKKILFIFILAITFTSCNKYEDGPSISFRSAGKRLTGKWEISKILFDKNDISLGYFASNLNSYPFSIYSDWSKDYFIGISHTDGTVIAQSDLALNDKKTTITFALVPQKLYESIANDIFCTIPTLRETTVWMILRLKNDELWIATDFETNNYELHFDLVADFSDY